LIWNLPAAAALPLIGFAELSFFVEAGAELPHSKLWANG
jgi:hypothetical protein